jgi:hypothetical protein
VSQDAQSVMASMQLRMGHHILEVLPERNHRLSEAENDGGSSPLLLPQLFVGFSSR